MITLFVFMALSRGTFSTLSPVMAAQQEERKRRESIDQSSASIKEALDIALDNTSNIPSSLPNNNITTTKANASAAGATDTTINLIPGVNPSTSSNNNASENTIPVITRKLNEIPKKPKNPRRHSDSPYHIVENTLYADKNYGSLGIEIQNDALHKKLSDILIQQQQNEQDQIEQVVPSSLEMNRSLVDEFNRNTDTPTMVKTRKRSSTSPSPSSQ
jgi:hypothetical protein